MSALLSSLPSLRAQKASAHKPVQPARRPESRSLAAGERNRLLVNLLPQVRYIARRIHDRLPSHVPFEDVYHTGVIGLIDALKKYDPRKKVQIQSYMKFRIRGAILDGLRELDWSPRELRRKARLIECVEHGLGARLGRTPAEVEIAEEMGVSLAQFQHLVGELRGLDLSSLQDVVTTSDDGAEQELCARLATASENDPYQVCAKTERNDALAQAVDQLPEKERLVLSLYYYEELTMKEIGRVLAVGESRVSQIHSLAMIRLRSLLRQSAPLAAGATAIPPRRAAAAPLSGAGSSR